MGDPLRFSSAPADAQRGALLDIIAGQPPLIAVLERLRDLALPDCWLVSGAIYNTVWNVLTERPPLTGIKDIDVFYFDAGDLSYDAEDAVIKRAAPVFADLPLPVEIRNQARVHLWYEDHFGQPYAALSSSREGIDRFASKTHAVAARLAEGGNIELYAPYGLDDMFSFRIVPNHIVDNQTTHERKAARAKSVWPEITIVPW
jgi:hypothetical protein